MIAVPAMRHYDFQSRLEAIWSDAVAQYRAGNRDPDRYFDDATLADLGSIGLGVMDVYDYAEDFVGGGEPDFATFVMICATRRDYFLNEQGGEWSDNRISVDALPPKDSAYRGIAWLPRIIPKALAKLRGEMPPDLMYGCGGDRKFFKANDIHPAECLRVAWAHQDDEAKIVDWVEARRERAGAAETSA